MIVAVLRIVLLFSVPYRSVILMIGIQQQQCFYLLIGWLLRVEREQLSSEINIYRDKSQSAS